MVPLTDRQIVEYFQRSYASVDGLWFVKLEERYGFDAALDLDEAVWRVMPKIQARKLKELTGLSRGIEALFECLTTKLSIEGFVFEANRNEDAGSFEVRVSECPWQSLLAKANRLHLGEKIGPRICDAEQAAWAKEFGGDIGFEFSDRMCRGGQCCRLRFAVKNA